MGGVGRRISVEVDPARVDHAVLARIHDYWRTKRGHRAMPSRADIDPSEIGECLGWICLLELLPSGEDFQLRLVGRSVGEYFSFDVKGMTVSEAFAPAGGQPARAVLGYALTAVDRKCVVRAFGDCAHAGPRHPAPHRFETLFLPLSDDDPNATMLLGAFAFEGKQSQPAPAIAAA